MIHNIFGCAFVLIVVGWLAWLSLALWDLRDWAQKSLTGRQHFVPPTADQTDEALRRFTFGGGNDGRNSGLNYVRDETPSHAQAISTHQTDTDRPSESTTGRKRGLHGE